MNTQSNPLEDLRASLPSLDDDSPTERLAQTDSAPRAANPGRRVIGFVLAILLMPMVVMLLMSLAFSPSQVTSENVGQSSSIALQTDPQEQSLQVLLDATSNYVIEGVSDPITADLDMRLSELDARLVLLDSFVEQMAAHLDQQSSLLVDLQTGQAAQDDVIARIEASHQDIRKSLQRKAQATAKAQTPIAHRESQTPAHKFDYRVSSIRHLGNSTSVLIWVDGQAQLLTLGQSLHGWRLVSADAQRLSAQFLHSSGQRKEVQL